MEAHGDFTIEVEWHQMTISCQHAGVWSSHSKLFAHMYHQRNGWAVACMKGESNGGFASRGFAKSRQVDNLSLQTADNSTSQVGSYSLLFDQRPAPIYKTLYTNLNTQLGCTYCPTSIQLDRRSKFTTFRLHAVQNYLNVVSHESTHCT